MELDAVEKEEKIGLRYTAATSNSISPFLAGPVQLLFIPDRIMLY